MSKYTNILIVDDEVLIAEFLKDILQSFSFQHIRLAHSSVQATTEIEKLKPSLILLDIRMTTKIEGIVLAEKINELYQVPFIFITAHSDTEILHKALSTKPKGYITKPIKKADVYAAVQLALSNTESVNAQATLAFKDGHSIFNIPTSIILYAKSEGNYLDVVTDKKVYTIRYSLQWLIENLPVNEFKKVHRSYVVNSKKVTQVTSKSVFINNIEIPLSRNVELDF